MKYKTKVWLIGVAVLVVFVLLTWGVGAALGLEGRDLRILRLALGALGLVAAGLVILFLRGRGGDEEQEEDEIDLAMAAAGERLAAARPKAGARASKLPLVLVLGPGGSTKTSVVVRSGLDPELLAGEVLRGDTVAPTSGINVWYSQGILLLEAGGAVVDDPGRWARLIRHIQPARWGAVFGRREQAPRVAVVCFACDQLAQAGGAEALAEAARTLRGRLAAAARQLGIRLPVYVLFTKADSLPYFRDYVRSFSRAESREVLGTTLPAAAAAAGAGSYAERESRRIDAALRSLFHSLALRRLEVLSREERQEVKAGAYEFPREFQKLSERITTFLVELSKPSQLGVSPFLRGFYFTGVRPVVVEDPADEAVAGVPESPAAVKAATMVFDPRRLERLSPEPPPARGSRRVPEWVFLPRLFPEVILADRSALRATAGGARVNVLRRAVVAALAVVGLVLTLGFTVSFANNRALQQHVLETTGAAAGVRAADGATPTAEELHRLDALRQQTELLARYRRDGRPWRLRWGLYTGDRLEPHARRIYFDRFDQLLWASTHAALLSHLRRLPDAPNDASDYGASYDALRAHLVTTGDYGRSTASLLAPVLLAHWSAAREPDPEQEELARRQFDFFARELPHGARVTAVRDAAAVEQARAFLAEFADEERVYRRLVAEASETADAVRFSAEAPGAEAVLRNGVVVPGAFTREGWAAVHRQLEDVDALFAGEAWVVGEQTLDGRDSDALARQLRERYVDEYTRYWAEFLRGAALARFTSAGDAARKLDRLSSPDSPLLHMLALASRHTAVDSAVAGSFQPAQLVVPPDATERYIGESNQSYMAALAGLQLSLEQLAAASGPARDMAESQAAGNVESAKLAIRQLAQGFSIDGEARRTGEAVRALMEAPVGQAEGLLRVLPLAELNEKGRSFCAGFDALLAKYPFNRAAAQEADVDEIAAMFEPGRSRLWAFYDDALADIIVRQGPVYAAAPGARTRPSAAFVQFFNRAAEVSRGFFGEAGSEVRVPFAVRAHTTEEIEEVTIAIDGQTGRFTRQRTGIQPFEWDGGAASSARIRARVRGADVTVAAPRLGSWALFRMFQGAEWQSAGQGRYTVRWPLPGTGSSLRADIEFLDRRPPIFRPGYFDGLRCVPRITG